MMRQKVGKERSQEVFAPLAIPRRNGPNLAELTPVCECRAAPAPGFRDSGWRGVAAGGTLHQVGSHGAGWSTKTAGNDTYYLRFDCGWLVPQNSSCRAYGLQLRCLQE